MENKNSSNLKNKKTLILIIIVFILSSIAIAITIPLVLLKKPSNSVIKENYLICDNQKFTIDANTEWLCNRYEQYEDDYTFVDLEGTEHTVNRTLITEFNLVKLEQISEAPDNYLRDLCWSFSSMVKCNILIPTSITTVGKYFCNSMFDRCYVLENINNDFNIPQNIVSVGESFCGGMFSETPVVLPNNFNLPPNITTIGFSFCNRMFYNYKNKYIPSKFNIPQNITDSVGATSNFFSEMFSNSKIETLPSSFVIPSLSFGASTFCKQMFDGCSELEYGNENSGTGLLLPSMPEGSSSPYYKIFNNCTILNGASFPIDGTQGQTYSIARN